MTNTEVENGKTASTAEPAAGQTAAGQESVPAADLSAQLEAVSAERDQLKDLLLRTRADFDNFRKRVERERQEFVEFAGMESARALVPILDDFERALRVESADKEYAAGMELIYQRLLGALKKLGLEPITASGRRFDPEAHHAVETVESTEVEDHTVLEEYQRGYNFRGKLLRPAMVKVAVSS